MEFSRQEYWSRLSFPSPGNLPDPGIEPRSPALRADSLPSEPPGKPIISACWHSGGADGTAHWKWTSIRQSRCGPGNWSSHQCGFFIPSARPFPVCPQLLLLIILSPHHYLCILETELPFQQHHGSSLRAYWWLTSPFCLLFPHYENSLETSLFSLCSPGPHLNCPMLVRFQQVVEALRW